MYKIIKQKPVYLSILFCLYILITAHTLKHQPLLIISDKPIEDIVIICQWRSATGNLHTGGRSITRKEGVLTKSGILTRCPTNWFAGINLSTPTSYTTILHPTYTTTGEQTDVGSYKRITLKPKTVILDMVNVDMKNGDFNKYINFPGYPSCYFGYDYLKYYSKHRKLNVNYFKSNYHNEILACLEKQNQIINNYFSNNSRYTKYIKVSPEKKMEQIWQSSTWQ